MTMNLKLETYRAFREQSQAHHHSLTWPKWKRIHWQMTGFEVPERAVEAQIVSGQKPQSFECLSGDELEKYYAKKHYQGVDLKYRSFVEAFSNYQGLYRATKNQVVAEPIVMSFNFSDYRRLADEHVIIAEENAELSVIIHYHEEGVKELDGPTTDYHMGLIKVFAQAGAKVKLLVVQNLSNQRPHIMNVISDVERDAEVKLLHIDLGGSFIASDYTQWLRGENANAATEGIYLGTGQQKLDLRYDVQHLTKRSYSLIDVHGALAGHARKVFRGDLKFHRGAARSEGSEREYVILLDETVHSDAIPALLCDEDDVRGEHAASAGKVNEEQLFYLMSRGFSEKEAKKLIITASYAGVIDQIDDETLLEQINQKIEEKLLDV